MTLPLLSCSTADVRLFAAALLTVGRANFYTFSGSGDGLLVASLCVLACWGHGSAVRRLVQQDTRALVHAALRWATAEPLAAHRLAARQPFMREGWRPDPADNAPLPVGVLGLLHRWETQPWHDVKTFVSLAERQCVAVARRTQRRHGHWLSSVVANLYEGQSMASALLGSLDLIELAEIGSIVMDVCPVPPPTTAVPRALQNRQS